MEGPSKFLNALMLVLTFAGRVLAREGAPAHGILREITVRSEAVGHNLLGIPADQRVSIYLPPGYESPGTRYPVLYLLHGIGDDSRVWTAELRINELADRLISEGRLTPAIIVMPNAMTPYGGSFYVDSPVVGGWERFLSKELVEAVDRQFRTIASAASRAVAGHSMGGFGALRLGASHPDVFTGAYAMSPCCLDLVEDIGYANQEWLEALRFQSLEDVQASIRARRFYPVSMLALASALSPNPSKPPFFVDLPVRAADRGALRLEGEVARRWRSQMPVWEAAIRARNLAQLKMIYLDYGTDDQFAHIPVGATRYSQELARLGIPHVLAVYRGDHRDAVRDRLTQFVLPLVSRQFGEGR